MIRTVLISLVVLFVASVAIAAPAGWPESLRFNITGAGNPYDGVYELPWVEPTGFVGSGAEWSAVGVVQGPPGYASVTVDWAGDDFASVVASGYGSSWAAGEFVGPGEGWSVASVPEGGMTASVGSLFNLVVSSALSALTPGVALIVGVGVTLFLVALLLVVVRGRLLHVAVAGRSPVASSSVRQGPSRRMSSSGRRGVGLGEKKRTRHV